jgi:CRISPR-associated endonuclease/helicase Cas3
VTAFAQWFARVTGNAPYDWQLTLAEDWTCRDRMIRIPTGFGKTAGVVLAWLYHRVIRADESWPRRLVFCLPMRVLVEQTERATRGWLTSAGQSDTVGLHVLMGGISADRWVQDVDRPAILIGTQDMLLSRALNRGYGAGRGLWPMEFGLLHQDVLWTLDEVQLMDVGLTTTVQLAAFREADSVKANGRLRPAHTWWMSATLQPRWLGTVDHQPPSEVPLSIPAGKRKGGLFDVRKTLHRAREVQGAQAIARCAAELHRPGTLTLVITNRVATAIDVYDAVIDHLTEGKGHARKRRPDSAEVKLVHSRFRGVERAQWADAFLKRDAALPDAGRIVIATQVVEAGVDISARTLITELAPWSSLVQRFGRAARYEGEFADVFVVEDVPSDDKAAAPYERQQLDAADTGLERLLAREASASPRTLEALEDELAKRDPTLLMRLYPYDPLHVLRRRDLEDLFDTSADLSGTDLDVSRYIRSGEDRDVSVFWRSIDSEDEMQLAEAPRREELCPVPIGDIRGWKGNAYVLDYLDAVWRPRETRRLVPGMTILLDARAGGYTPERGWGGKVRSVEPVAVAGELAPPLATASLTEGGDDLSAAPWKTIATHGLETEAQARTLCATLGIPEAVALIVALAARWHDAGKAHDCFQNAIADREDGATLGTRRDLAKAPAWRRPAYPERPGFRHELASTLALFELLRRRDPFHGALLGPHRELLAAIGLAPILPLAPLEHVLADEIALLSAEEFDLLAWLVCSHHGKVRCVWTSTPHDQEKGHGGIHGVCDGDALPAFAMADGRGAIVEAPSVTLSLAASEMGLGALYGASWTERVAGLRARHGPFVLAFLEAVLRVADWRASMLTSADPLA